jgi:hypothetical protein
VKAIDMNMNRAIRTALLLGLGLWLSGCAPVSPWERGHLAKSHMALAPHPTQSSLRDHIYVAREGALGGGMAVGGGCGCN